MYKLCKEQLHGLCREKELQWPGLTTFTTYLAEFSNMSGEDNSSCKFLSDEVMFFGYFHFIYS